MIKCCDERHAGRHGDRAEPAALRDYARSEYIKLGGDNPEVLNNTFGDFGGLNDGYSVGQAFNCT